MTSSWQRGAAAQRLVRGGLRRRRSSRSADRHTHPLGDQRSGGGAADPAGAAGHCGRPSGRGCELVGAGCLAGGPVLMRNRRSQRRACGRRGALQRQPTAACATPDPAAGCGRGSPSMASRREASRRRPSAHDPGGPSVSPTQHQIPAACRPSTGTPAFGRRHRAPATRRIALARPRRARRRGPLGAHCPSRAAAQPGTDPSVSYSATTQIIATTRTGDAESQQGQPRRCAIYRCRSGAPPPEGGRAGVIQADNITPGPGLRLHLGRRKPAARPLAASAPGRR